MTIDLNRVPKRKLRILEQTSLTDLQTDLYDYVHYITDDGYKAPDIGNDIQDLNTDAVRRKIRPYYDRNKHVLPIYTHIAGYLKCMLDTCLDIDIVKTINEQKTEA